MIRISRLPTLPFALVVLPVVIAAVLIAFISSVRPAHAELEGPCSATLARTDVARVDSSKRSDDIKVDRHSRVSFSMQAPEGFKAHHIELDYGGIGWTVSSKTDDGSREFSDTVEVNDYAKYGVGIYKVIGVATTMTGKTCTGEVTVHVTGNPLGTIAGAAAAAVVIATTGGAIAGAAGAAAFGTADDSMADAEDAMDDEVERGERTRRPPYEPTRQLLSDEEETMKDLDDLDQALNRGRWIGCMAAFPIALLTLPFMAITPGRPGPDDGEAGAPAGTPPRRLPRMRWNPRVSLFGAICGLFSGLGGVVLLQQYAIELPTLSVLVRTVAAGVLVYGVALPTFGRTIKVWRVNRRLAAIERRAAK